MKNRRRYRVKWRNVFKLLILIAILTIIISTLYSCLTIIKDYSRNSSILKKIKNETVISNVVDNEATYIVEPEENISKFASYWNYIKLSLMEVNMSSLKNINKEIVGWIELKGTDINYPLVKHSDNEFYKTHSFDQSKNHLGAIYLDSNTDLEELPKSTVIYGNKDLFVLFKNLKTVFRDSWKKDDNHYIIRYCNEKYTTLWQIVSVYKEEGLSGIKTSFIDDEDYNSYLTDIINKSTFDFKTKVKSDDKIITLTTNSSGNNIVVHAKLIKEKSL